MLPEKIDEDDPDFLSLTINEILNMGFYNAMKKYPFYHKTIYKLYMENVYFLSNTEEGIRHFKDYYDLKK